MIALQGYWFDGKTSASVAAEVQVDSAGRLRTIRLADRDLLLECDFADLRISSRLGNTPRFLYFAGGEKFETLDNNLVDHLLHQYRPSRLNTFAHQLESHIYFVAITLLLVAAMSWAGVKYGLPAASKAIAYRLPQQVMDLASKETLEILDKTHFKPTRLSQDVQDRLLRNFAPALNENNNWHLRILFREGGDMGANAFALPDGTLVFTDEMVQLAKDDNELLTVLAHEIGHVKYRHSLRSAIQASSLGFIVSMLVGDLSAASGALVALPMILTTMSYSRDFEREADQHALAYLQMHNIDPDKFVSLMERVTYEAHCTGLLKLQAAETKEKANQDKDKEIIQEEGTEEPVAELTEQQKAARKLQCDQLIEAHKSDKSKLMDYFSTHPATEERLLKFKAAK